jgi:hypothetical protein
MVKSIQWAKPSLSLTAPAHDYPQLYGAFMTPSFLKDGGRTFYFIMPFVVRRRERRTANGER